MKHYDPARIRGRVLSIPELNRLFLFLRGLPLRRRRDVAGLAPERADIILAGLLITIEVMTAFALRELTVTDGGLLLGLLTRLLQEESHTHVEPLDTQGLYL
jgi:exopolyphosphatase/guanosine-5'-triphosphate,3'-diphosphate pyrophosphatase